MYEHYRKPGSLLLLLVLLCTLLAPGSAQEAAPQDMLTVYRDVMAGTLPYLQSDPYEGTVTEAVMAPEISHWYGFSFVPPIEYVAFAVTDLDQDGSPELLLKLSEDFGFELLRWYDGDVYSYPFVYRAMIAITVDGEINASSGASNCGWLTLYFDGIDILRNSVCWMSDEASDTIRYTVGGELVSEDEFRALDDALWAKDTIEWTDYTPESLNAAVTDE